MTPAHALRNRCQASTGKTRKDLGRVVVIGGGPAGFFGAIEAGRQLQGTNLPAKVIILESTNKLLHKVAISGGGRCNVMHDHAKPVKELAMGYPRGQRELLGPLSAQFGPKDTYKWFRAEGVELKVEDDGRCFPITDDSSTIVDCLSKAASRAGVEVRSNCKVKAVERLEPSGFRVLVDVKGGAKELICDRLLLATGSARDGYRIAASLGHKISDPVPSLFTLEIKNDPRLAEMAGVAVKEAEIRVEAPNRDSLKAAGLKANPKQRGPILFTHTGISGPAVLKLSAFGARLFHQLSYKFEVLIDWAPDMSKAELMEALQRFKMSMGKKAMGTFCPLERVQEDHFTGEYQREALMPRRLWAKLLTAAGVDPDSKWGSLTPKAIDSLVDDLQASRFAVSGKGAFKEEFVTCGGVSLREVDFKTMGSKLVPGLHFAGEVMDIDGITGGYNLQSCWCTGWTAGRGMAQELVLAHQQATENLGERSEA